MQSTLKIRITVIILFILFSTPSGAGGQTIRLKILHINDLHGHILPEKIGKFPAGGAACLAGLINQERAANPEGTVLLSAGDMFQGTPISNVFRGRPVIEIMNYLKFDAMALGNHEFDWGTYTLRNIMKLCSCPVLGANITAPGGKLIDGTSDYILLERKGLKIAVIGIITPETAVTTKPDNVKGLTFAEPESALPKLVRETRGRGAAIVVVLSHCGLERDRKIASSVPGIDLIVGGHSHTAIETPCRIGDTVIVQAGWGGMYLGVLDIEYDKKARKITSYTEKDELRAVAAGPDRPFDAQVAKMIEYYENQIREEFSQIVGESAVDLTRSYISESNIGNVICDAIRESTSARIAFQNSGGIRSDIPVGQITLGQVFIALPFDNQLISMDLTGRQIADVLEENAAGQFGILQVSGLNIKLMQMRLLVTG